MTDTPATTPKSDGEQLLDAQFLLGMIERYRPGTAQEARDWFGGLLKDAFVKADAASAQLIKDATPDRNLMNEPCTI